MAKTAVLHSIPLERAPVKPGRSPRPTGSLVTGVLIPHDSRISISPVDSEAPAPLPRKHKRNTPEEREELLARSLGELPSLFFTEFLKERLARDERLARSASSRGTTRPLDFRCAVLLVEGLETDAAVREKDYVYPRDSVRELLNAVLDDESKVASSAVVMMRAGYTRSGVHTFPDTLTRLTVTLCADAERAKALWQSVAASEDVLVAAEKNRLRSPRYVKGSIRLDRGTANRYETLAEQHVGEILHEWFESESGKNASVGAVEFRGHVVYEGTDVPKAIVDELRQSLRDALPTALAKGIGSARQPPHFQLDLRIKSRQDRPQAVVPGESAWDSWFYQYQLPEEEDVVSGVVEGESGTEGAREAVRALSATLPADYLQQKQALATLHAGVRSEIAKSLESALNAHCSTLPQQTYDEKRALAKWVNAELRSLGLAIRDPKSGQPCLLVGDPGNRPSQGRFLLDYVDASGTRVHALTSVTLPPLELMPDDLSRAPYGSRTQRSR